MHTRTGFSVLACASIFAMTTSASQAETVTFAAFSNYYPPNLFAEFEAATGISVDVVEIATNEELIGRMLASNGEGFDLMIVSSPALTTMRNLGMLAELDHAKLPNLANLFPEAFELAYDPGLKYSIPYAWVNTGICYRSDLLSFEPTSWMDVLQPRDEIKGRYTLLPDERWFLEPAQLATGHSVNDVSPETLEEIRPLLLSARKDVMTFDGFTYWQRLLSGESVMAVGFDGHCNLAIKENPDVKWLIPKEGTDLIVDVLAIPAKSENPEGAAKLMNFILGAEQHGWLINEFFYKVPNKAAMEAADPELIAKYNSFQADPKKILEWEIHEELGDEAPRVSQFVTEIMNSN